MTNQELFKGIGTAIAAALLVLAKPMWDVITKQSKVLFMRKKIESQKKIQTIIDDIRAKLRVDRVEIFEYSNGETTLGGLPFLFGSLTFESKEEYLNSRKREMQRFPTSWNASMVSPIIPTTSRMCLWNNNGDCFIDGKEKIIDRTSGELVRSQDMKSILIIKFTANISDGVVYLASYQHDIEINEYDLYELLSDIRNIWYHLKIKI